MENPVLSKMVNVTFLFYFNLQDHQQGWDFKKDKNFFNFEIWSYSFFQDTSSDQQRFNIKCLVRSIDYKIIIQTWLLTFWFILRNFKFSSNKICWSIGIKFTFNKIWRMVNLMPVLVQNILLYEHFLERCEIFVLCKS